MLISYNPSANCEFAYLNSVLRRKFQCAIYHGTLFLFETDVYDVMNHGIPGNKQLSYTTEQECCVSLHNIIGDEDVDSKCLNCF